FFFFFSSRRRHTRSDRDWSSDVCSSDLMRHFAIRSASVLSTRRSAQSPRPIWRLIRRAGMPPTGRLAIPPRCALKVRQPIGQKRSEERRVGKEWRVWWWGGDVKKKEKKE